MASTPSLATCRLTNGFTSRKASCVSRRSPGLSSTKRTCRGMLCSSGSLLGFRQNPPRPQAYAPCASVVRSLRQPDLLHPELIDALDQALERVQLHRLGEIAIGLELIAFQNVAFRLGCSQDYGGNGLQTGIFLDAG